MFTWVVQGQLFRAHRPGYSGGKDVPVAQADVDDWINRVRKHGIRSIICLLGGDQLGLYAALRTDLLCYYRQNGFSVEHVPACDHQQPPLSKDHLQRIWEAYKRLPKAVLVHCSAGIDRTGRAIEHIKQCLRRPPMNA